MTSEKSQSRVSPLISMLSVGSPVIALLALPVLAVFLVIADPSPLKMAHWFEQYYTVATGIFVILASTLLVHGIHQFHTGQLGD